MSSSDRHIFLTGEIDEKNTEDVIRRILSSPFEKDLRVVVNSPGGCEYSALALFDIIDYHQLETAAVGQCMSAAVLVVAAGRKRFAYQNTQWMMHRGSIELAEMRPDAAKETLTHLESMCALWYSLVAERSQLSRQELERKCDLEYYFDSERALEYGFVDILL